MIEKRKFGAAWLLLDNKAGVDRVGKRGRTPLYVACQNCHTDAARLCLKCRAKVDQADKKGATPLYNVCFEGHVDAARLC